ncbi:MAG: phosphotransferase family protein [Acidimicrobiaceae bacterium]|nr:phosphotransferase family protein [Acidimicrobiaceae bacterium]MCY4176426.1 phosphotransferase family protein [Acidimicrobiaceae bacterium]MCY4280672.1 phosphotransferase family protein [Acidimicrobiaceae bacterium]
MSKTVTPKGIDRAPLTAWLSTELGLAAPLDFQPVAGGASNLTFVVSDATGRRVVLRRPPTAHVLSSAHDMTREHRVISALARTAVPVPPALALCRDDSVNGADFYVMGFVEGSVIHDREDAQQVPTDLRRVMADSLVDTLAELHAVDPAAAGLADLGRRDGHCSRQLRRWQRQVDQGSDRALPRVRRLHDRLSARIPVQQGAGIVHGDYRLDNCIMSADGSVAAVLDWELCTLGDVLIDVAGLVAWWGAAEAVGRLAEMPTTVGGFGTLEGLLDRYRRRSSRDLSELEWYVALQFWRVACIIEGVRVRHGAGAMGDNQQYDDAGARMFIDYALDRCEQSLEASA